MPYSEAQKRATMKYRKEQLSRLTLDLKPEERELIGTAAAAAGKSIRAYIVDLVREAQNKKD